MAYLRVLPLEGSFVEKWLLIDHLMLQRVWQELDYRIDVCRVTRGGYMEHL
jgi:hypothetical protein